MTDSLEIRANEEANSQVSPEAKDRLTSWLKEYDVNTDSVLLHHYSAGEFVAVSWWGSDREQTAAYNQAYSDAVSGYWRNRDVGDNCFWVHREWIADLE